MLAVALDVGIDLTSLQLDDNESTAYLVQAVFEGDEPCSATAYAFTPNSTEYAVCTTVQYGFKPAVNSTMLTVEPQATQIATTTKTPEEMEQEAERSGQVITEPKFSWWSPWFWLQTTTSYPESQMTLVTCASIFGGWMESCCGLENPLYTIFEGASSQQTEILTSTAISSITLAAATFIGGYIATKATEWNPVAYFVASLAYFGIALSVIIGASFLPDVYTSRTVLITAGWTLLALSTLGFTKTIPIYLSNIVGSDPVTTSIKCIINTLLGIAITTAILKALGVSLGGFLFYILTFILGITALCIGYTKA